jgi:competence ComEA-like helix-hairpin-helix protein
LAVAGIEQAKALLFHDDLDRQNTAQNHRDTLFDAPQYFQDVEFARGHFRVVRPARPEEGGPVIYGIADEESRLNVNYASADELSKLADMTQETAAAIVDWRDEDESAAQGGAETDHYAGLGATCLPRNGRFLSVRELLMVVGVSPPLLLGEDVNQNGLLDAAEDDGPASFPPDDGDGVLDAGWSGLLTAHSSVDNVTAQGVPRVNLQSAPEETLAAVEGISPELAKAIVAHRDKNKLESLADLFDVKEPGKEDQKAQSETGAAPKQREPAPEPEPSEPASPDEPARGLVDEQVLKQIADAVTATDALDKPGMLNVNTANASVLACLPGVDSDLAQTIVQYREANGFYPNPAYLLDVPGVTREIFRQIVSRVSCRSGTYRILSEGRVASTGARKRIEAIVRVADGEIVTVSYRDYL